MSLTPALVRWLQTEEARAWLDPLTTRPPNDAELLPTLTRLRQHLAADEASAIVTTAQLRQRAAAKFGEAAQGMFFSEDTLQQASPVIVAQHTAHRFAPYPWVADLGCGLGSDSLALAASGCNVLAADLDPAALALTQANARASHHTVRVHPTRADVLNPAWRVAAAWADPGRRDSNRRLFDPESLHPPLSALLEQHRAKNAQAVGIKLMPGLDHDAIPPDAEAEWISLNGELKEAVLWLGDLVRAPVRRATLLPSGAEIIAAGAEAPVYAPGAFLYEPDPAVIRAGAVSDLALTLDLWRLDPTIAYLSGNTARPTPFARSWRILDHLPFELKALNRRLRALRAHVIAVKKRGSPIEPETFRRRLASEPDGRPVIVVLTRVNDKPWALICAANE